jgi:hypothetical protein
VTGKGYAPMSEAIRICRSCASDNLMEFDAMLKLHFPPLHGLDRLPLSTRVKLVVCLDCNFAQFDLSAVELRLLRESTMRPCRN